MWIIKKLVSRLFFPLPLCLEIMLVGLVLLWFTKRQKAGKTLVTVGVLLLTLLSSGPVGDWLLHELEYRHPALQNPDDVVATSVERPVKWIAVLGGGYTPDPRLSDSARPSPRTLSRLVEGVRLHHLLPGSKLIVSAEKSGLSGEVAKTLSALAFLLGVKKEDLILAESARDTAEEVTLIRGTVEEEPFVLVTSASHMPRALSLFQAQAMRPIPAPTDYLVRKNLENDPSLYFPSADHLRKSEHAFYEYLALGWVKVGGR